MDAPEGGSADDGRIMGVVIGCYLVCLGCCSVCLTTGVVLLIASGSLCLMNEDEEDCGESGYPGGGITMLFFGLLPLVVGLAACAYLQGEKHGWWRPSYIAPGAAMSAATINGNLVANK